MADKEPSKTEPGTPYVELNQSGSDLTKNKEFQQSIEELKTLASKDGPTTGYEIVQKLISETYVNPFDVLMLGPEASEEEIKKQFKTLSLQVHPDKNNHEKATEAFHIIERAYKTLQDQDQRKLYQRIMREARERVEYERRLTNKKRTAQGLAPLPQETFQTDVRIMTKKLFNEIEEKKVHFQRMAESSRKRMREEKERMEKIETERKEEQKEWEHTRDKRVKSWRRFRDGRLNGKKKGRYEMRAPEVRAEQRPEEGRHLINDDYKKSWK